MSPEEGNAQTSAVARERQQPILFVDVDGVISLFGFGSASGELPGRFHWIDGVAHCIPDEVGPRLVRLGQRFELVWATGWEEKANEYLPFLLDLSQPQLPVLTFGGRAVFGSAHWKLEAIGEYAGDRPAAWVDDNIDDSCRLWAQSRRAETLLVCTESDKGLTDDHVEELLRWAERLGPAPAKDAA